jgi:hypothetical protein
VVVEVVIVIVIVIVVVVVVVDIAKNFLRCCIYSGFWNRFSKEEQKDSLNA